MKEIDSAVSVVPLCTGSSKLSYDGTTVFCVVHGPLDGTQRNSDPSKAALDVRWKDPVVINGRIYDKYFSSVVTNILSKYIILELDGGKTIQIVLNVAGSIRNTLFCAVNAALLALVDSGIPLRTMFYASSSFGYEEEVFVFDADGKMSFGHSFGPIEDSCINTAAEFLQYVKDVQAFALKPKLLLID
ncbi:RNase PH-like protein [Ordospora colligata]|uniref:RNase PH-like protein n=1 Tax=Ordospora colligata OC4 TaxID=1354746 RepID=A0A0B2UK46_9MICR|nr:RNase PH-like protein [Ordospora colligata OC4]KHN69614.1 RNase PH-like protein [Ordospora colligata OC4]TBU15733.1 RNase PH-like protein [Ordospora colligata]TBU15861.1 RNase PH-like protein [Ordospora colligata]TBU18755.1 RNase PH-like protein [Ordospora colligata]